MNAQMGEMEAITCEHEPEISDHKMRICSIRMKAKKSGDRKMVKSINLDMCTEELRRTYSEYETFDSTKKKLSEYFHKNVEEAVNNCTVIIVRKKVRVLEI